MGKLISEREKDIICHHYAENWPIRKIAAYANLSQGSVMKVLKERNVPLRGGKRISPKQEQQVIDLYKAGESILDIIAETGVKSEQTVYRILRDFGANRRRKRG